MIAEMRNEGSLTNTKTYQKEIEDVEEIEEYEDLKEAKESKDAKEKRGNQLFEAMRPEWEGSDDNYESEKRLWLTVEIKTLIFHIRYSTFSLTSSFLIPL